MSGLDQVICPVAESDWDVFTEHKLSRVYEAEPESQVSIVVLWAFLVCRPFVLQWHSCCLLLCLFMVAFCWRLGFKRSLFKEMVIIHRGLLMSFYLLLNLPLCQALLLSIWSTHSHTLFGVPCSLIVVDVGALPKKDLCAQPVGLPVWNLVLWQKIQNSVGRGRKGRTFL